MTLMYKHQTLIVNLNFTKTINWFFKSDWLITMLFQGQQRCSSRNMSHLVKSGFDLLQTWFHMILICTMWMYNIVQMYDTTYDIWQEKDEGPPLTPLLNTTITGAKTYKRDCSNSYELATNSPKCKIVTHCHEIALELLYYFLSRVLEVVAHWKSCRSLLISGLSVNNGFSFGLFITQISCGFGRW